MGGSGGVTCNCTEGTGCDPIKMGGVYGCLMRDCSSCGKSATFIDGINAKLIDIAIFDANYNIFVDDFSQIDEHFLLPHLFIENPAIKKLVLGLENGSLESFTKEKKIIFINAYGYILPLEVPADIDDTSIAFKALVNGSPGGGVCSCNTSGSCPKNKKYTVVWCDSSNCTSCTMAGKIINNSGTTKKMTTKNGLISIY